MQKGNENETRNFKQQREMNIKLYIFVYIYLSRKCTTMHTHTHLHMHSCTHLYVMCLPAFLRLGLNVTHTPRGPHCMRCMQHAACTSDMLLTFCSISFFLSVSKLFGTHNFPNDYVCIQLSLHLQQLQL